MKHIQMPAAATARDGPLFTQRFHGDHRDLRIEKGNAFVWKPIAMSADERIQFSWGGPVFVTDKGAEVLYKRSQGMISIA
jgi:hypothetical protein